MVHLNYNNLPKLQIILTAGTGKTTTLKALLNALHQREYNRYYDKLLQLARVSPEETPAAWERLSELRWNCVFVFDDLAVRESPAGFLCQLSRNRSS